MIKNPPANATDIRSIPGPGRSTCCGSPNSCTRTPEPEPWSPRAATTEACIPCGPCSTARESLAARGPCTSTREKPGSLSEREVHVQQQRSSTAINKYTDISFKKRERDKYENAAGICNQVIPDMLMFLDPWFWVIPSLVYKFPFNSVSLPTQWLHTALVNSLWFTFAIFGCWQL